MYRKLLPIHIHARRKLVGFSPLRNTTTLITFSSSSDICSYLQQSNAFHLSQSVPYRTVPYRRSI